jgi:hypothetical protein
MDANRLDAGVGVFLKSSSLIGLLLAGGAAYLLLKNKQGIATTDYGETMESFVPPPTTGNLTSVSSGGALRQQTFLSPTEGVKMINSVVGSGGTLLSAGRTLVKQNSTFTDEKGNTYRTGSNQTVSRLANNQVKVLTVRSVTPGTSRWGAS